MGGAEALDVPYEAKRLERLAEKRAIAEYVADLVSDGDSLVLDSGSSTYALAEALQVRNHLTVATNDIRIAHYFAARQAAFVSSSAVVSSSTRSSPWSGRPRWPFSRASTLTGPFSARTRSTRTQESRT